VPRSSKPAEKPPSRGLHDQLARLGLIRDQDLVLHLPLRYEDHTRIVPLAELQLGGEQQAEGTVVNTDIRFRPRRQLVSLLEEDGQDGRGRAQLVLRFFHFYPSHQKTLAPGKRVRVFGEVREGHFGREIVHPQFKIVDLGTPLPDRLTPVYPTTAGLAQEALRKVIARALASDAALVTESLPEWLVSRERLWKFPDAVQFLHAPPPRLSKLAQQALGDRTHPAWTRLKFDELIAQQLSLKAHRKARASRRAPVLTGTGALTDALVARVPFKLTQAQQRVWREITRDLKRAMPMQRLLQGDVGSGKTIIAALAALQAIESGRQVAFMAPTEILAEQHYRKLAQWLEGLPGHHRVARRRHGGESAQESACRHRERRSDVRDRHARAVRGRSEFAAARPRDRRRAASLRRRAAAQAARQGNGRSASLMMSATPIPRTLAMTFYADLDVSAIDEMPPGRTPVATRLVNNQRRAR
jgi:ATP-dependent DNA helicase RecG